METTIKSKYEVGNIVTVDKYSYGKIVKIMLDYQSSSYYFRYLLELDDESRKWVSEYNIVDIKENM